MPMNTIPPHEHICKEEDRITKLEARADFKEQRIDDLDKKIDILDRKLDDINTNIQQLQLQSLKDDKEIDLRLKSVETTLSNTRMLGAFAVSVLSVVIAGIGVFVAFIH